MANKPVLDKRFGSIKIAVWDNEKTSKRDGAKFLVRSFNVQKSWPNPKWVFGSKTENQYVDRDIPINKSDLIDLYCAVVFMMEHNHIPKIEKPTREEDAEAFL